MHDAKWPRMYCTHNKLIKSLQMPHSGQMKLGVIMETKYQPITREKMKYTKKKQEIENEKSKTK